MFADSPTRHKFPLSYKKITKKTITSVLPVFILLMFINFIAISVFVIGQASGSFNANPLILFMMIGSVSLLGLYALIQYLYQKAYFDTYYYDLNEHFIVIKKGVFFPREINIPYERVQDVYVDQDLFDRLLSIYDVHLSSATVTSGMHAHIDGVEKVPADGLRDELLNKIHQKISKK